MIPLYEECDKKKKEKHCCLCVYYTYVCVHIQVVQELLWHYTECPNCDPTLVHEYFQFRVFSISSTTFWFLILELSMITEILKLKLTQDLKVAENSVFLHFINIWKTIDAFIYRIYRFQFLWSLLSWHAITDLGDPLYVWIHRVISKFYFGDSPSPCRCTSI